MGLAWMLLSTYRQPMTLATFNATSDICGLAREHRRARPRQLAADGTHAPRAAASARHCAVGDTARLGGR
eukprot:1931247-Pyramimonas_sp.AAC.1